MNELPGITGGRIWPRTDPLQNAKPRDSAGQGMKCQSGVSGTEGEHFPGKSHLEIVFPVKLQLQSVTVMRPNDGEEGGF